VRAVACVPEQLFCADHARPHRDHLRGPAQPRQVSEARPGCTPLFATHAPGLHGLRLHPVQHRHHYP